MVEIREITTYFIKIKGEQGTFPSSTGEEIPGYLAFMASLCYVAAIDLFLFLMVW